MVLPDLTNNGTISEPSSNNHVITLLNYYGNVLHDSLKVVVGVCVCVATVLYWQGHTVPMINGRWVYPEL